MVLYALALLKFSILGLGAEVSYAATTPAVPKSASPQNIFKTNPSKPMPAILAPAPPAIKPRTDRAELPIQKTKHSFAVLVQYALLGPTQFQTFEYSETSDDFKFSPNMRSTAVLAKYLYSTEDYTLDLHMLNRIFPSYENTVQKHVAGRTEKVWSVYTVEASRFALGVGIGRTPTPQSYWFPRIDITFEQALVSATETVSATATSASSTATVKSNLKLAYLEFWSPWGIVAKDAIFCIGPLYLAPIASQKKEAANSVAEDLLLDDLSHRPNPGVGVMALAAFRL
jgi:hypothetical protein